MQYDFDRVIDRRNTCSIKYDPASRGKPDDILPMWVADMDFAAPPCVSDALAACARHGIYGYSEPDAGYFAAVRDWFEKRFHWDIEQKWLVCTPGVVNALSVAIRACTQPGDGVLIQQPVYYPFESCVRLAERKLLVNELAYSGGRYSIDFDDFEMKIKEAKLFILCSPHNPVGRVWTRDELARMGEICLRHGAMVISDEIHQDFVFPGHEHLVFAAVDKSLADITITCTSPSKTFNLAGLLHANIFIQNEAVRKQFIHEYARCGLSQPGIMGLASCRAAYSGGAEWLDALVGYLAGNMALIHEFAQANIPKMKLVPPEGTYLAWLDFSQFGLSPKELDTWITREAKLWLNSGAQFGAGGAGFARMNAACPRSVVRAALERLKNAQRPPTHSF